MPTGVFKRKPFSKEHKENISKGKIKYFKDNPQAIEEMRKRMTGENSPNFNKHHSEETKRKMSLAKKGRFNSNGRLGMKLSQETKDKISISHMGLKPSIESRKKMSISAIKYMKKGFNKNIFPRVGIYEKRILDELEETYQIKVIRQFFINGYFIDGYIPEWNLAIEIDEEHHQRSDMSDFKRQQSISNLLNCDFIRIKLSKDTEEEIIVSNSEEKNIAKINLNEPLPEGL